MLQVENAGAVFIQNRHFSSLQIYTRVSFIHSQSFGTSPWDSCPWVTAGTCTLSLPCGGRGHPLCCPSILICQTIPWGTTENPEVSPSAHRQGQAGCPLGTGLGHSSAIARDFPGCCDSSWLRSLWVGLAWDSIRCLLLCKMRTLHFLS